MSCRCSGRGVRRTRSPGCGSRCLRRFRLTLRGRGRASLNSRDRRLPNLHRRPRVENRSRSDRLRVSSDNRRHRHDLVKHSLRLREDALRGVLGIAGVRGVAASSFLSVSFVIAVLLGNSLVGNSLVGDSLAGEQPCWEDRLNVVGGNSLCSTQGKRGRERKDKLTTNRLRTQMMGRNTRTRRSRRLSGSRRGSRISAFGCETRVARGTASVPLCRSSCCARREALETACRLGESGGDERERDESNTVHFGFGY